jgi:hypothetical protein
MGWQEVSLLDGRKMLVARTKVKSIKPIYRVWLDGFEYLAVEDEVDLLWMGKTPTQLDLDPAGDEVPDYRKSEPLYESIDGGRGGRFI